MKSTNPIFKDKLLEQTRALYEKPMTISGTMSKLIILSLIMMVSGSAVFYQYSLMHIDFINTLTFAGAIIAFIIGLIISLKPSTSPYLAPVYAFTQGAALTGISCFYESMYKGMVMQAVSITMITVFSMAILYKTGLIKATEKFKSAVMGATTAIAAFYLISLVLMLFHVNVPYFTSTSPLAIFINVVFASIAALYLVIDFDFIEKGNERMLPETYEWYGAFGLLVTIVWLYIEILRLLARLKNR